MFKDSFKGTGGMKEFVDEHNRMAKALNNMTVKMPRNYTGKPIQAKIEGGKIVIDMTDSTL